MPSADRYQGEVYSRRWFLVSAPVIGPVLAWAAVGTTTPAEPLRYLDAATENAVTRLTDPANDSALPPPPARSLDRRANFLLYTSDLSGRREAYRLDFKKSETRQLTEARSLSLLTLLPGDNAFCYIDGSVLYTATFSRLSARELYRAPEGGRLTQLSVSIDGLFAALIEEQGTTHRLRLLNLRSGAVTTLAEVEGIELFDPIPRPRRASVLYRRGSGEIWLANYDGKQNYRLRLAPGSLRSARWSPDGRTVLYLNVPSDPGKLRNIREFVPDSNEDHHVADTTQYDSFDCNSDASMFLGISASVASPYVFLLARKVNRELVLCEQRRAASPVFSSDSQRVFFDSDMHGKRAIYTMDVARLVEETEVRA